MSLLDVLRSLRTVRQSVWLEFIGVYKEKSADLYSFFEGRDDLSFYQPHLRRGAGATKVFRCFYCNGKDPLIELIPRIMRKIDDNSRAMFFIDKDLDDYCNINRPLDSMLFETEVYSIENYIVNADAISVIWTDLLQLQESDPRFAKILDAYGSAYQSFVGCMACVMSWIIHLRRTGHGVILNDVSMNKVVKLDENLMSTLRENWSSHIVAASNTKGVLYDESFCDEVRREIDGRDPKTFIRGKFELWFFIAFVSRTIGTLAERSGDSPRAVLSVPVNMNTAIDILAPRLRTPPLLEAFLAKILT